MKLKFFEQFAVYVASGSVEKVRQFCEFLQTFKKLDIESEEIRDINSFIEGVTLLHIAVSNGHTEVAKILLENGADLNIPDNHGRTALYIALEKGDTETVRILLEYKADPNIPTRDLLPIIMVTMKNHTDVLELLLKSGVNPNVPEKDGKLTALFVASYKGYTKAVRILLEHDADPNNRSIPAVAVNQGHAEILRLLFEYGVDPSTFRVHFGPFQITLYTLFNREYNNNVRTTLKTYFTLTKMRSYFTFIDNIKRISDLKDAFRLSAEDFVKTVEVVLPLIAKKLEVLDISNINFLCHLPEIVRGTEYFNDINFYLTSFLLGLPIEMFPDKCSKLQFIFPILLETRENHDIARLIVHVYNEMVEKDHQAIRFEIEDVLNNTALFQKAIAGYCDKKTLVVEKQRMKFFSRREDNRREDNEDNQVALELQSLSYK